MGLSVHVRRIYDEPTHNDGTRVLVDRVWPRGIKKADAKLDDWNKGVAPSTDLRKWYGHDPEKFDEFKTRYKEELDSPAGKEALEQLKASVRHTRVTLLTATKDVGRSQAVVLAEILDPNFSAPDES